MAIDFKIIHGDAKLKLAELDAASIDLTVTSPPYDNLREYKGFTFDFEGIAKELFRVTKPGGVVVWVVGDATVNGSETGTSFRQALFFKEIGFNLHDTMIWNKKGFTGVGSVSIRYAPVFEYMFVLSKGTPKVFNPLRDRKNLHSGSNGKSATTRLPSGELIRKQHKGNKIQDYGIRFNIWNISPEMSNTLRCHPAQFPEQLANDHIKSWSNEGDTVLDCFLGSGTTGKMAVINKRNFIGIEISSEYIEIAEARIKRAMLIPCDLPQRLIETDLPLFR